jgi:hypothetical protein
MAGEVFSPSTGRRIPRHELRPGMSDQYIFDTLRALANPEMFDLLTTQGGQTADT